MTTPEITAASASVADAKLQEESGAVSLAAAVDVADGIRARLADLHGKRAKIVAARKSGNARADHGAELAEIGADVEGLNELLDDATAASVNAGVKMHRWPA